MKNMNFILFVGQHFNSSCNANFVYVSFEYFSEKRGIKFPHLFLLNTCPGTRNPLKIKLQATKISLAGTTETCAAFAIGNYLKFFFLVNS